MTCPVCGADTRVIDCVADCESVHRKRKCKDCGRIFYTTETDAATQTLFYDAKNRYYRARYDEKKKKL